MIMENCKNKGIKQVLKNSNLRRLQDIELQIIIAEI